MVKVLVVQGAGMNMRGKAQIELFGTDTLDQVNARIRDWAKGLGVEVDIFHSNIEGEVVNKLYQAHDSGVDAVVMNPAGYTTGTGALLTAITQIKCPVIEVHASNPATRGTVSNVQKVAKGLVYGFGYFGYYLALQAAKDMALKKK